MKNLDLELCPERSAFLAGQFEEMYRCYNRIEFVDPDPVSVVREFPLLPDREVAGLIASSLAYGRASMIVRSARLVLGMMGKNPYAFVLGASDDHIRVLCEGFRHRFTDQQDLFDLIVSIRNGLTGFGSIENVFASGLNCSGERVLGGLMRLSDVLRKASGNRKNSLLPDPSLGSACKRYHLFLKWMVRQDQIDPGGWSCIGPDELLIPMDTHMHRICSELGLVKRKAADLGSVLEATGSFRKICPRDPARYDFALTRFGIRPDLKIVDLIGQCTDINV